MAPFSAKQFSPFLLLLSLLFSSHARDSQHFSKFPRTDPNKVPPAFPEQESQPSFYNDGDEKAHGLYVPAPPTTAALEKPPAPWRPWNYREDSYVTRPADEPERTASTATDGPVRRPYEQPEEYSKSRYEPAYRNRYNDMDAEEESNYRSSQLEDDDDDERYSEKSEVLAATNYIDGSRGQGMSDTRKLNGGKYYYDLNSEQFSNRNHPYYKLNNQNTKYYQSRDEDLDDDTNMP